MRGACWVVFIDEEGRRARPHRLGDAVPVAVVSDLNLSAVPIQEVVLKVVDIGHRRPEERRRLRISVRVVRGRSQRSHNFLAFDALGGGHLAQNGLKRTNTERLMIRNGHSHTRCDLGVSVWRIMWLPTWLTVR
jgi:hypothetical protein